jgi:charged multivesicular body protein 1
MDKLESHFKELSNAISQAPTTAVPQSDVEKLMQQMAEDAGLELNMQLPQVQTGAIGAPNRRNSDDSPSTTGIK